MKNIAGKAFLVGLSSLFLLTLSTVPASAQSSAGIQIKPAVLEDNATPGATYDFSISVTNLADFGRTLSLSSEDIEGVDEDGQPIFAAPGSQPTGYEISSWITLPGPSVTLDPGETRTIDIRVRVPANATPGSHFGGVFFDTGAVRPDSSGAAVGAKVGSLIALKIAGDVKEEARLREFSTDKLVYNAAAVNFTSKFENLGNVLLRPHGLIEVTNMWGKQVGSIEVNATAAGVFPKSYRTFGSGWTSEGFAFGRYQAIVSLVYGDEARRTVSGTTSFWILPLKPIAITLGTILILVFGLYAFLRSYIRRKLRAMGVPDGRADASLYGKRYQNASSRLMMVVLGIGFICIVFLALLFLLFA